MRSYLIVSGRRKKREVLVVVEVRRRQDAWDGGRWWLRRILTEMVSHDNLGEDGL